MNPDYFENEEEFKDAEQNVEWLGDPDRKTNDDLLEKLELIKKQISNLGPDVAEKVVKDFIKIHAKEIGLNGIFN